MRSPRARLLPAAVLTFALVTACGGSGDGGSEDDGAKKQDKKSSQPDASKSPDASGSDPKEGKAPAADGDTLSAKDLEKAALTTDDVEQYRVVKLSESDKEGMGEEKAKSPECRPISALVSGVPEPEPAASTVRQLMSTSDDPTDPAPSVLEVLASYDKAGAEKFIPDLRSAVDACDGGFSTQSGSGKATYTGIDPMKAPAEADDAYSFRLNRDMQGTELPMAVHVVRQGKTMVAFLATSLTESTTSKVPAAVITAQVDKLT